MLFAENLQVVHKKVQTVTKKFISQLLDLFIIEVKDLIEKLSIRDYLYWLARLKNSICFPNAALKMSEQLY